MNLLKLQFKEKIKNEPRTNSIEHLKGLGRFIMIDETSYTLCDNLNCFFEYGNKTLCI